MAKRTALLGFLLCGLAACGSTIDIKPVPDVDAGPPVDAVRPDARPTAPPGGWPVVPPGGLTVPPAPQSPLLPNGRFTPPVDQRPLADCRILPVPPPSPDICKPDIFDSFETLPPDWTYFEVCLDAANCTGGYTLKGANGVAAITGDAYMKRAGLQRDLPVYADRPFWISFRWRVTSRNEGFLGAATENMLVEIIDPSGGMLYRKTVSAPILSTGTCWQLYAENISREVEGQFRVTVRISMMDISSEDFQQTLYVENFRLQTCLPDMGTGRPF